MSEQPEPHIIVNGQPLSTAQAMAVRVAVTAWLGQLQAGDADELGPVGPLYAARLGEVVQLMIPSVHHMHGGVTPCGMRGTPNTWPPGHRWSIDWSDVTCARCNVARPQPATERAHITP